MIYALSGLGAEQPTASVQCAAGLCCMPEEQYRARTESLNNAIKESADMSRQRMYFLGAGAAFGLLVGFLAGRLG